MKNVILTILIMTNLFSFTLLYAFYSGIMAKVTLSSIESEDTEIVAVYNP